MSKMAAAVKEERTKETRKPVTNFMGGTSYELNPVETMKMVTASSIFGEPQYYRDGEFAEKTSTKDGTFHINGLMADTCVPGMDKYVGLKTSQIMEQVIDEALRFNFGAVLDWAVTLRHEFLMRLNPQIIMVRAACMAEERKAFTQNHPGRFNQVNQAVMRRGDDVVNQITYYLFRNGGKSRIPGILKNSWKSRVERMTRYELNKYREAGIGLINAIRICHAHNENIAELMTTGSVEVAMDDKTCESLRVSGMSWDQIRNTIRLNHMTLLKNLRGIFKEITDPAVADQLLAQLEKGVRNGNQFPYRYLSARNAVAESESVSNKAAILDSLDNCMDIACGNLPKLPGNNAFLSDNSGSAWGACPSEYGTMTVAEIGNLSSIIGAVGSDRGTLFTFGDRLKEHPISKRDGILSQASAINRNRGRDVGHSTENGVWIFFRDAIRDKIHYDNIFIYSDMQAGHGELYGTDRGFSEYRREYDCGVRHIDVAKLIRTYRAQVNPKVNVYCVQTAGYTNVLVPENGYRTNVLYGWTGRELVYADAMNRFWDEYDLSRKMQKGQAQETQ